MSTAELFFASRHTIGMVNYKPIAPGHVLLVPRRLVERFGDLTVEEVSDLFLSVQQVSKVVEREFKVSPSFS